MGQASTTAFRRTLLITGRSSAIRIAMIAITTSNSMIVNAFERGLNARRMIAPLFGLDVIRPHRCARPWDVTLAGGRKGWIVTGGEEIASEGEARRLSSPLLGLQPSPGSDFIVAL